MKDKKTEFRSLNEELPALYAEELEQRLETDPLAVGGLLNLSQTEVSPMSKDCWIDVCWED